MPGLTQFLYLLFSQHFTLLLHLLGSLKTSRTDSVCCSPRCQRSPDYMHIRLTLLFSLSLLLILFLSVIHTQLWEGRINRMTTHKTVQKVQHLLQVLQYHTSPSCKGPITTYFFVLFEWTWTAEWIPMLSYSHFWARQLAPLIRYEWFLLSALWTHMTSACLPGLLAEIIVTVQWRILSAGLQFHTLELNAEWLSLCLKIQKLNQTLFEDNVFFPTFLKNCLASCIYSSIFLLSSRYLSADIITLL